MPFVVFYCLSRLNEAAVVLGQPVWQLLATRLPALPERFARAISGETSLVDQSYRDADMSGATGVQVDIETFAKIRICGHLTFKGLTALLQLRFLRFKAKRNGKSPVCQFCSSSLLRIPDGEQQ